MEVERSLVEEISNLPEVQTIEKGLLPFLPLNEDGRNHSQTDLVQKLRFDNGNYSI